LQGESWRQRSIFCAGNTVRLPIAFPVNSGAPSSQKWNVRRKIPEIMLDKIVRRRHAAKVDLRALKG